MATAVQMANTDNRNILKKILEFKVEFGPSTKDILNFTTQLSVMIRAGISLPDALESIGMQSENDKFKAILMDIKNKIEAGHNFSQALNEYPNVFSPLYTNMVAAAEVSGSLGNMLNQLATYLADEAETRAQVKAAMVYPAIIAFIAISSTIFLLTFVLPKFIGIFAGKEHLLPGPTKAIMAISAVLRGYWYYLVPATAAAIWGLWVYINTPNGRNIWDMLKLKIPLMQSLCKSLYISRGLHTMGVLINAGVPILDTIAITAEISGNVHYNRIWMKVHESVRQGKKIATTLSTFPLIPASVSQMISSGEESGTMGEVLSDISDYYEKQLKNNIKMVTSMIEPIMIVVMGAVVGFIAMSVLLPIFKVSSLVAS